MTNREDHQETCPNTGEFCGWRKFCHEYLGELSAQEADIVLRQVSQNSRIKFFKSKTGSEDDSEIAESIEDQQDVITTALQASEFGSICTDYGICGTEATLIVNALANGLIVRIR